MLKEKPSSGVEFIKKEENNTFLKHLLLSSTLPERWCLKYPPLSYPLHFPKSEDFLKPKENKNLHFMVFRKAE